MGWSTQNDWDPVVQFEDGTTKTIGAHLIQFKRNEEETIS